MWLAHKMLTLQFPCHFLILTASGLGQNILQLLQNSQCLSTYSRILLGLSRELQAGGRQMRVYNTRYPFYFSKTDLKMGQNFINDILQSVVCILNRQSYFIVSGGTRREKNFVDHLNQQLMLQQASNQVERQTATVYCGDICKIIPRCESWIRY